MNVPRIEETYSRGQMQAMFRLGQKDMQQNVLELIQRLKASASGITHITLETLAEMIGKIEVEP
jgi:hypothetical protein